MSEKEAIKQIKIMLKVRREQKKIIECAGGSCVNCEPDILALQIVLQLIEQKNSMINKIREYCKDTIKEEREFMKDLEHKNVAFHYANGRETLSKEILKILEE